MHLIISSGLLLDWNFLELCLDLLCCIGRKFVYRRLRRSEWTWYTRDTVISLTRWQLNHHLEDAKVLTKDVWGEGIALLIKQIWWLIWKVCKSFIINSNWGLWIHPNGWHQDWRMAILDMKVWIWIDRSLLKS